MPLRNRNWADRQRNRMTAYERIYLCAGLPGLGQLVPQYVPHCRSTAPASILAGLF